MARARKAASKSRTKSRAKTKTIAKPRLKSKTAARPATQFKCPECGKTFARAAALGAHRRRAHGVAGSSTQARASAKRRASVGDRRATTAPSRSVSNGRRRDVDRDALLRALFPSGLPAREEVIRSVNGWLNEAERLSRL